MGRKLSTYESGVGQGYCEVHMDFKDEYAYIKYFDNHNKMFFREEFPNFSLAEVNSIAQKWADGQHKLFED